MLDPEYSGAVVYMNYFGRMCTDDSSTRQEAFKRAQLFPMLAELPLLSWQTERGTVTAGGIDVSR